MKTLHNQFGIRNRQKESARLPKSFVSKAISSIFQELKLRTDTQKCGMDGLKGLTSATSNQNVFDCPYLIENRANRYLNTMVGIEVEVENVPLDTLPRFPGWSVKRDESLRNNGYEFVTDVGLRVYDVPNKLNRLFKYMESGKKSNPGLYDFNERTSIHVHVDATRLSLDEIKNILIVYTLFEDSLFNIAGHARKHNVFCVPVRFLAMSDITYNMGLDRLLGNWKKYCAINFSRIGDIGTIEFRHMEGNMDYQRILSWVSLLTMLVDFGRMVTVKGLEEEILKLKYMSNYYQFAEKVFGPFVKFIDIVPEEFDQAVSDSKFFLTLRT